MTTITTMQQLEQVPDGTTITVATPSGIHPSNSRVWTMREGRLHLDGTALDPVHFQSAINEGLINVGDSMQEGQIYRSSDGVTSYYVLSPANEEGHWNVLITHRWAYYDLRTNLREMTDSVRLAEMGSRSTEQVQFDTLAFSMGRLALGHWQRVREQREQLDRHASTPAVADQSGTVRHLESRIEGINTALIDFHNDTLSDSDERAELVELMVNHDLTAPTREVELRITVSGSSSISGDDLDSATLRDLGELPSLDSFSGDGSITVNWEHEFNRTETYLGSETDPCEDTDWVNEDMVRDWLNDMGVPYESFEISNRRCQHC